MAIVFLGIAIAASTFVILNMVNKKNTAVSAESKKASVILSTVDLEDAISTNIFDENGEQHIARVVLSFGVDKSSKEFKKFEEAVKDKKVIIRNEIIHIIKAQTYEMMSKADVQEKLSDEITPRINELLNTEIIQKVYFGDIFVQ